VKVASFAELLEQLRAEMRARDARRDAELEQLRAEVRSLQRGRAGLDAGRNKAILKAKQDAAPRATIQTMVEVDEKKGYPPRGRAGRISRALGGKPCESQVRKILRALSSVRDSREQTCDLEGDKRDARRAA